MAQAWTADDFGRGESKLLARRASDCRAEYAAFLWEGMFRDWC